MRKMSSNGINFLIAREGLKCSVYPDTNGYPTIGIGHMLTKDELSSGKIFICGECIKYRNGLTHDQVHSLLSQDLTQRETTVEYFVTVPLHQNQFDCLVSFVYNVGDYAFKESTLLRLLNKGRYSEVPNQLRRWVKNHDGTINQGLKNRREFEVELWNKKEGEDETQT